jgi:nucleoside-diphosphate-sugar epimerase
MKVFVAGASGALGMPLIGQLQAHGHTVLGLVRERPHDGGQSGELEHSSLQCQSAWWSASTSSFKATTEVHRNSPTSPT